MENNQVYIHKAEYNKYPDKSDQFSPSIYYPEYSFSTEISKSQNVVYDMIRECLHNMDFDKEHFGTKDWNPLKELIKPGDVVVLKPNMVMHENQKPEHGMDCLITHPSLVRAILDYVILALCGKGTVIIGDAPMQSCDFETLVYKQGYLDIIEFYREKDIQIELVDFRNYKTVNKEGILHKVQNETINNEIQIDLGKKSEFATIENNRFGRLRVTNYDHSVMYEHHNCEKNEYLISKMVLEADVFINMPKPKTHSKAGVTISLKNIVGINTNKEWLPHHSEGSTEEGGDEYSAKSLLKKTRTYLVEKKDDFMIRGMEQKAKTYSKSARGFSILTRIFCKDQYYDGSWYGNDTIWRTILDLNKIIFFTDKYGNIQGNKQRKMLIIADMIVSGEGAGPLAPTPKNVGIIAMGMNPVSFDEAISAIMGFDPSLISTIRNARNIKEYAFAEVNETIIKSNNPIYNLKRPHEITYKDSLKFKPTIGWHGYLHQS